MGGTSVRVEWVTMGTFFGRQCGATRGRDRRPNLVGGVEGESHRQNA